MNEYKKTEKFEMINLMINGETLELRSGAELFFKENDKCESPFRFKYRDAEMPLSEAWGHECRVKDVPKIVPYTIDTFPFDRDGGMWFNYKYCKNSFSVMGVIETGIKTRDGFREFDSFLDACNWRDGSPCGIVE